MLSIFSERNKKWPLEPTRWTQSFSAALNSYVHCHCRNECKQDTGGFLCITYPMHSSFVLYRMFFFPGHQSCKNILVEPLDYVEQVRWVGLPSTRTKKHSYSSFWRSTCPRPPMNGVWGIAEPYLCVFLHIYSSFLLEIRSPKTQMNVRCKGR